MALVAPLICRYTIVGTLAGQDCQNIFDVRLTDTGLPNRAEGLTTIAGDLMNQWSDHVMPLLVDDYIAEEVRWVDLNEEDGSTGSRSSTDSVTWPEPGGSVGAPLPNNCYAKMVKNLEGKTRLQRNGALRLGGIREEDTLAGAPNTLDPAFRAAINTAFEDLKDGINGQFGTATTNLVVVHTVNLEYTGYSEISNYACAPVVGTIRRRMPGYGT